MGNLNWYRCPKLNSYIYRKILRHVRSKYYNQYLVILSPSRHARLGRHLVRVLNLHYPWLFFVNLTFWRNFSKGLPEPMSGEFSTLFCRGRCLENKIRKLTYKYKVLVHLNFVLIYTMIFLGILTLEKWKGTLRFVSQFFLIKTWKPRTSWKSCRINTAIPSYYPQQILFRRFRLLKLLYILSASKAKLYLFDIWHVKFKIRYGSNHLRYNPPVNVVVIL